MDQQTYYLARVDVLNWIQEIYRLLLWRKAPETISCYLNYPFIDKLRITDFIVN